MVDPKENKCISWEQQFYMKWVQNSNLNKHLYI